MKKITQPVSPEPATIDYSTNPDYYLCIDCKEWKVLKQDFYLHKGGKPVTKRCKICQRLEDQRIADNQKRENGGSMMVPQRCNVYFDDYQKQNTFELMTLFGYLFDEPTGIWYKPGVKEIVDGKPVFLKLKKVIEKRGRSRILNEELIKKVVEWRNKKLTYKQIGKKLSISSTTVRKCLMYNEEDRTHQGG